MVKYLIATVLLVLIGYGFVEAWPLVAGPSIFIISPENNSVYQDGIVDISGKAIRVAKLTLNGTPVLREENGEFYITLAFPSGGSILTFVATDRFGRKVTATRSILVQTSNKQLIINN